MKVRFFIELLILPVLALTISCGGGVSDDTSEPKIGASDPASSETVSEKSPVIKVSQSSNEIYKNESIIFDFTESYDEDSVDLEVYWELRDDSAVVVDTGNSTSLIVRFADLDPQQYFLSAYIFDGHNKSFELETLTFRVNAQERTVSLGLVDRIFSLNEHVEIDQSDLLARLENSIFTDFVWTLIQKPTNSVISYSEFHSPVISFYPDAVGDYKFEVYAKSDTLVTAKEEFIIRIDNSHWLDFFPVDAVFSEKNNEVIVASTYPSAIQIVDPTTYLVETIELDIDPVSISLNDEAETLLVSANYELLLIDLSKREIVSRISTDRVGSVITFGPGNNAIMAATYGSNGHVSYIDIDTGTITKSGLKGVGDEAVFVYSNDKSVMYASFRHRNLYRFETSSSSFEYIGEVPGTYGVNLLWNDGTTKGVGAANMSGEFYTLDSTSDQFLYSGSIELGNYDFLTNVSYVTDSESYQLSINNTGSSNDFLHGYDTLDDLNENRIVTVDRQYLSTKSTVTLPWADIVSIESGYSNIFPYESKFVFKNQDTGKRMSLLFAGENLNGRYNEEECKTALWVLPDQTPSEKP